MNRKIIILLFVVIYIIYISYITLNLEIIYWLLHSFGEPQYIVTVTLLYLLPSFVLALIVRKTHLFFVILTVVILVAWFLSGTLTYTDFKTPAKMIDYYQETGCIPYDDFVAVEIFFYVLLWGFTLFLDKTFLHIKFKTIVLIPVCCFVILCTFIVKSPTDDSMVIDTSSFRIPSEPIFLRVTDNGDCIDVTVGKDEKFLEEVASFKARKNFNGFSFRYLYNDTIVFNENDSSNVSIINGNYSIQNIVSKDYLYIYFREPQTNVEVSQFTRKNGMISKRVIPL